MEVYLGKRPVRQIRDAARDAIEDGDSEALREEILDAFAEDDVRAIERALGGEDLYEFINTMLDDWSGDDIDELFELLESQFAEVGIDLTTEYQGDVDDREVLEEEDDFPADDEEAADVFEDGAATGGAADDEGEGEGEAGAEGEAEDEEDLGGAVADDEDL
jgi:hypothetical protein